MNDLIQKVQNYDWRSLKRFTSAQASNDFNAFMDKLPQNVGQTMIAFVSAAWIFAGGAGLYTMVQLQTLTELRAELVDTNSVRPAVPELVMKPLRGQGIKDITDRMSEIYKDLDIQSSGGSITIAAASTAQYGSFREAIGYVQSTGKNIRADIETLCVGRECERKPLSVTLKLNKIDVN